MKSVLHEASSILKAVEKAWEASGKPTEFTVKVLEQGEKKFLFFSSRPAIVSISFDPKYVTKTPSTASKNKRPGQPGGSTQEKLLNGTSTPQLESVSRNNPRGRQQQQSQPRQNTQQNQIRSTRPVQQVPQPVKPATPAQEQQRQQVRPLQQSSQEPIAVWTPELASFVNKELKEILHIMGITIPFQEKIDQKTLTVTFAQSPLENREDARLLYISLSYLLIQATKKLEKKKLRGFHLIVNAAS